MLELGTGIWIILCSSKNSFAQKQKKMKNIMKQKQKISNITKQTKPLKLLYMKSLAFHQTHRKWKHNVVTYFFHKLFVKQIGLRVWLTTH